MRAERLSVSAVYAQLERLVVPELHHRRGEAIPPTDSGASAVDGAAPARMAEVYWIAEHQGR